MELVVVMDMELQVQHQTQQHQVKHSIKEVEDMESALEFHMVVDTNLAVQLHMAELRLTHLIKAVEDMQLFHMVVDMADSVTLQLMAVLRLTHSIKVGTVAMESFLIQVDSQAAQQMLEHQVKRSRWI